MFLAEGIATCYGCGSCMRVRSTNNRWQYECRARRHNLLPELGHATRSTRLVDAFLSYELSLLIEYEGLAVSMWPRTLADDRQHKLADLRKRVGYRAANSGTTDTPLACRLLPQLFDAIVLWPIGRGRGHGDRWWWHAEQTISLVPSSRMTAAIAELQPADRDDVLMRYADVIPPGAAAS
jgi:hypothetical protein